MKIESDRVDVWRANLDLPEEQVDRLRQVLSADELARADRFHFLSDQRRFVVCRAALRQILALYVGDDPASLIFRYGPYGKPYLDKPDRGADIQFNVSHSGALGLLAVARQRQVGVEIWDYVRDVSDHLAIAERHFAPGEIASLRRIPDERRTEAFFTCWTRKEAFTKATGQGLSLPLDGFEVSVDPDLPPVLTTGTPDLPGAQSWSLRDLAIEAGYRAAVAAEGSGWAVRLRRFSETPGLSGDVDDE